jgi:N-acetylneuraminic acid mutarotase
MVGQAAVASQYEVLAGAAVFDPTSGFLTMLGSQAHAGANAAASLMADGRLLATGGSISRVAESSAVATVDIFDPATNAWTAAAAPMATARAAHVQTTLSNGSVLVTGGSDGFLTVLASAEIYVPNTNTWSAAGAMSSARYQHSATLLSNGMVLAAGGSSQADQPSGCSCTTYLAAADLYNPTSNAWTATGPPDGSL